MESAEYVPRWEVADVWKRPFLGKRAPPGAKGGGSLLKGWALGTNEGPQGTRDGLRNFVRRESRLTMAV